MLTDWLGRRLFPRWQHYRQKREVKTLIVALWVGIGVAAIMTAVLFFTNSMSIGP